MSDPDYAQIALDAHRDEQRRIEDRRRLAEEERRAAEAERLDRVTGLAIEALTALYGSVTVIPRTALTDVHLSRETMSGESLCFMFAGAPWSVEVRAGRTRDTLTLGPLRVFTQGRWGSGLTSTPSNLISLGDALQQRARWKSRPLSSSDDATEAVE